jgi:hypothetical protein
MMILALFENETLARAHRAQLGGWVFLVEGSPLAWWFDLSHTPSRVICHPVLTGASGKLV